MEKLINLYYEYKLDLLKREMRVNWATEREIEMADIEKVEEEELEENLNKLLELKRFVKRIVKNDKIDERKIPMEDFYPERREEYVLLMLLAISDNHTEELISYLK